MNLNSFPFFLGDNFAKLSKVLTKFDKKITEYEKQGLLDKALKLRLKVIQFLFNEYRQIRDPELREDILDEITSRLNDLESSLCNRISIQVSEHSDSSEPDFSMFLREPTRRLEELIGDGIRRAGIFVVELIKTAINLKGKVPAFDDRTNIANILLVGEPGTGKTHFAEGTARKLIEEGYNVHFIAITGADIKSKFYSESQKTLAMLLRWADKIAEESNGISIVFIDEFDEIATRDDHRETSSITNTLLALTSGVNAVKNVVIIAATNLPDRIDPAIYSRFNVIEFYEPEEHVKGLILKRFLGNFDGFIDPSRIGAMLKGLSGRDIKKIAINAIVLARLSGRSKVNLIDIKNAITISKGRI